MRVTSRTGSTWKRSVELSSASGEDGWLSSAHRSQASSLVAGAAREGSADGKAIIERLCISLPYVEEHLNSKVIKSFVPELRSRKCFSCFKIPMFYVYMLWTLYVRFTHFCIWLWYRLHTYNDTKLYLLRIVTWYYNYLQMIIISYWNHTITWKKDEQINTIHCKTNPLRINTYTNDPNILLNQNKFFWSL